LYSMSPSVGMLPTGGSPIDLGSIVSSFRGEVTFN
jgi:hypothetical protein